MQYMLITYVNQSGWGTLTKAQQEQGMAAYQAYTDALSKAGALVSANRLGMAAEAATVRLDAGKPRVLDGPYADTKEQFGGYFVIDVTDHDAAISWAARCPAADHGAVEVRPIWAM
jgi:hypothetical protein